MNQDINFGKEKSSHASLAFSPEMKPLNSIELYTKISPWIYVVLKKETGALAPLGTKYYKEEKKLYKANLHDLHSDLVI